MNFVNNGEKEVLAIYFEGVVLKRCAREGTIILAGDKTGDISHAVEV